MSTPTRVQNDTLAHLIDAENVLIRATNLATVESVCYTPTDLALYEVDPWRHQYVDEHTADQQAARDALCQDAGFTLDEWRGYWQAMLRDAESAAAENF